MRTRQHIWHRSSGISAKKLAEMAGVRPEDVKGAISRCWFSEDGYEPEVLNLTPGAHFPCWSISPAGVERYVEAVRFNRSQEWLKARRDGTRAKWSRGVYIIRTEEGPRRYKIGHTIDLRKRLCAIRTMSPVALAVVAFIPNREMPTERRLHEILARHRLHGEWFAESPALLYLCEKHSYTEAT